MPVVQNLLDQFLNPRNIERRRFDVLIYPVGRVVHPADQSLKRLNILVRLRVQQRPKRNANGINSGLANLRSTQRAHSQIRDAPVFIVETLEMQTIEFQHGARPVVRHDQFDGIGGIHRNRYWRRLGIRITLRETWAFSAVKITDAVWWFYLFWCGKFLYDRFGLDIKGLALPFIIIYVTADFGSIGGGWLSGYFIKKKWPINRARKVAMLICATFILPVMFAATIPTTFQVNPAFFQKLQNTTYTVEREVIVEGRSTRQKTRESASPAAIAALQAQDGKSYNSAKEFLAAMTSTLGADQAKTMEQALLNCARSDNWYWLAVVLIAMATSGHQAWSCNVFTLVSDVFPKKAIASVTGIGGMVGAVAGVLADFSLGKVLTSAGPAGYFFAFLIAGSMYLVLLGVAHLLMPKMTPLDDNLRHVARE